MNLQSLRAYALARLQEGSTWRGLVLLATACGMQISPERQDLIVTLGLAAAGLVGALFPDQGGRHG